MVAPSNGASNPHHWSTEGISTPGESRQFRSRALRRTIALPRWSKSNRTRISPECLRERVDSRSEVWGPAGALAGLNAARQAEWFEACSAIPSSREWQQSQRIYLGRGGSNGRDV